MNVKKRIEEITSKHKWKLNQSEKSEAIASTFVRYVGVNKIHEMHNDEIDKLKEEILKEIQKRVQGLLEEIEKEYKTIAGNDKREILWHIWDKNLVPKIIHAEQYIVPLNKEERAEFVANIVWTLGRSSQLAILELVEQKIKKAFKGVVRE